MNDSASYLAVSPLTGLISTIMLSARAPGRIWTITLSAWIPTLMADMSVNSRYHKQRALCCGRGSLEPKRDEASRSQSRALSPVQRMDLRTVAVDSTVLMGR